VEGGGAPKISLLRRTVNPSAGKCSLGCMGSELKIDRANLRPCMKDRTGSITCQKDTH
jgi:hypothetical protein